MTCDTIRNELVAYRDGELPEWERAQVDAHLRGCPACAQEERQLARLDHLLAGLERMPLSPGFAATFWQRLEQEQRATKKESRLGHWWRDWVDSWRMVPAFAAAASVLIFFGYVLSSRQTPEPPQSPPAELAAQAAQADAPPQVVEQPDLFVNYRVIADLEPAPGPETELADPEDLPPPLLENPSFFVHYPLLQKMEELQNFEAVLSLPGDAEKQNRG